MPRCPPVAIRYDKIIEKIWKTDPALAELILERTIRFRRPRRSRYPAMIHWAELLQSTNRTDDAAACYREAIRQWKEVPLLTGQNQNALTPKSPRCRLTILCELRSYRMTNGRKGTSRRTVENGSIPRWIPQC